MVADAGQLSAFKAFDFEGSKEWKAHLRNVELPPGNPEAALLKVKAKWYRKNVDPDFSLSWLASSVPSSQQQSSAPQQEQRQQSGSTRSAPQTSGTAHAGGPTQTFARQLLTALLQAIILVLAVVYLQPLKPELSSWAYRRLTVALAASQALKLHTAFGMPNGFNLAALKAWWARVQRTSDAHYFLLAVAALVSAPHTYLLLPFLVLAVYQLAFFLSEHCSNRPLWQQHGEKAYQWLVQHKQQALLLNAQTEIMNGFTLLVSLILPSRRPLLMLMVWQVLRLRYWSVDAAIHHRQIWQALDQLTAGYRQRLPIFQKAVNFGVTFFQQGRQ
ncbi:hypothetical protein COO60DRAFT_1701483 [Scenedesmus sp. NREL 46B-D3]|nr:hypothetical protein COO60DRAFT_1701483 [Scenedesmus sp. NREL 46B-D3]